MIDLEEIQQAIREKDDAGALKKLDALLVVYAKKYQPLLGFAFSFQHILESYFYDYFFKKNGRYSYTEEPIVSLYHLKGSLELKLCHFNKAKIAYEKALAWNPVDLDAMFQLAELYKRQKDPDVCKAYALQSYPFCCTRASMSRYYRNLGFYYLETKQPEIAAALYQYSNIFYSSKQAEGELDYLKKAGFPVENQPLQKLQSLLAAQDIPLGPNPDTLGIAYRVGCLEKEAGRADTARECLTMVYDLTRDEETLTLLKELDASKDK